MNRDAKRPTYGVINGVKVRHKPVMDYILRQQRALHETDAERARQAKLVEASRTVERRQAREIATINAQLRELSRSLWVRVGLTLRLVRWPSRHQIEPVDLQREASDARALERTQRRIATAEVEAINGAAAQIQAAEAQRVTAACPPDPAAIAAAKGGVAEERTIESCAEKVAAVFALLIVLAGPAGATTWTVSTTSQLAAALAGAVPGDLVRLGDGSYSGDLIPARSGTAAARITFIGNLANPAAVAIAGSLDLKDRNYVSVKGVSFGGELGMRGYAGVASHDSAVACIAKGGATLQGAQDCHLLSSKIGDGAGEDALDVTDYYGTPTRGCTFRDLTLNLRKTAQPHAVHFDKVVACSVTTVRAFITIPAGTSDVYGRIQYGLNRDGFRDNHWTLLNQTGRPNYVFAQRDYCLFNSYVRDTVDEAPGSSGGAYIRFATSGSFPGSCGYNAFTDCVFKSSITIDYQNNTRGDRHFGNTYISGDKAMDFTQLVDYADSIVFEHDTFFSASGVAADFRKTVRATLLENVYHSSTSACPGVYAPASPYRNDSSLYYQAAGTSSQAVGTVGCSAPPVGSRWGRPAFLNSSFAAMDSRVSGGESVGSYWPDGYVGAHTGSSNAGALVVTAPTVLRLVGTRLGVADTSGIYRVVVTDASGRPVGGARVELDFSGCPDIRVGAQSAQPFGGMTIDGQARTVSAFTNLAGMAAFDVVGGARGTGGACAVASAVPIRVNGSVLARTQVAAVDLDGAGGLSLVDVGMWIGDFYGGTYCARDDYNGDGKVTLADYARLADCYYRAGSYFSAVSYAW